MKKRELFKMLNDDTVTDRNWKITIDRINDTLYAFPQDVELDNITSIEKFAKSGAFRTSVLDGKRRDIGGELNTILSEVQTWVANKVQVYNLESRKNKFYEQKNAAYDRQSVAYRGASEELSGKLKWGQIIRVVFLAIFVALAVAAIICTIIRGKKGDNVLPFVPEIIGCADFVAGIGFTIYEGLDDRKKKKIHDDTNKEIGQAEEDIKSAESKIQNIDNSITQIGDNNQINIYNTYN